MKFEIEPYLGKLWTETEDCYSLLREFYLGVFDIELPDYARPPLWWEHSPQLDLFQTNFRDAGFLPTHATRLTLCFGDVLLMSIGNRVTNHCAVMVGNNYFLHKPFKERSRKDIFAGYWADRTMAIVRHPRVKPPFVERTLDLLAIKDRHAPRRDPLTLPHARPGARRPDPAQRGDS